MSSYETTKSVSNNILNDAFIEVEEYVSSTNTCIITEEEEAGNEEMNNWDECETQVDSSEENEWVEVGSEKKEANNKEKEHGNEKGDRNGEVQRRGGGYRGGGRGGRGYNNNYSGPGGNGYYGSERRTGGANYGFYGGNRNYRSGSRGGYRSGGYHNYGGQRGNGNFMRGGNAYSNNTRQVYSTPIGHDYQYHMMSMMLNQQQAHNGFPIHGHSGVGSQNGGGPLATTTVAGGPSIGQGRYYTTSAVTSNYIHTRAYGNRGRGGYDRTRGRDSREAREGDKDAEQNENKQTDMLQQLPPANNNAPVRGDSPRNSQGTNSANTSPLSSPESNNNNNNNRQLPPSSMAFPLQLRPVRNDAAAQVYPLIYVSPAGTISIVLSPRAIIETAVDRSLRLVCHNVFAIYMNARGTSSALIHSRARVLHTKDTVYSKFLSSPGGSSSDKMAVFGSNGVLFTMSHLQEAFLVSNDIKGASAVNLEELEFTPLDDTDYSLRLFYKEAPAGEQYAYACDEIIQNGTTYERKSDGSLVMQINGMLIRETTAGDIIVSHKPRHIECNPAKGTLHIRSGFLDAAVQDSEKAFVKKGGQRVHVSRSGMVVSDGNSVTSMDQYGRIVSCT